MTHPDFARAAAFISADGLRSLLMDLVDIASPTGRETGVAQYLVARMQRAGMDTDLPLVEPGRPNAVGHRHGLGDGLNLLFTGHMDTSYSGRRAASRRRGLPAKGDLSRRLGLGTWRQQHEERTCVGADRDRGDRQGRHRACGRYLVWRRGRRDREDRDRGIPGRGVFRLWHRHAASRDPRRHCRLRAPRRADRYADRASQHGRGLGAHHGRRHGRAFRARQPAERRQRDCADARAARRHREMGARLRGGASLHGRTAERDGCRDPRRRAVAAVAQPLRLQPLSRYPHRAGPDHRWRQARAARRAARLRRPQGHSGTGAARVRQRSAEPDRRKAYRSSRRWLRRSRP